MSSSAPRSAKVLLVEDDVDMRDALAMALGAAGYEVIEAASAEAAIAASANFGDNVDLVLTDIVLPGMNGVELARVLTSQRPRIRALFMSGYPNYVTQELGLANAEERFLSKPFSIDDLERKIRAELKHRAIEGATVSGA